MILLTVSEIAELHEKVFTATGGSKGIRDMGLLESAVE
jgi:prophage maintenance system killer protein